MLKTVLAAVMIAGAAMAQTVEVPNAINVDRVMRYWAKQNGHAALTYDANREHLWTQTCDGRPNSPIVVKATGIATLPTATELAAIEAAADADYAATLTATGTSGHAFQHLATKLAATGYTPVPQTQKDLIGSLPSIIAHIQALIDAKDAEIDAAGTLAEYKAKRKQRDTLTDGYNEIQSWALAMMIRQAAGK